MLDVEAAIPFKSELMLEKKSRLVLARRLELATREVLFVESLRLSDWFCLEKESP